ncbi:MAG: CPBP family intramembrane metalloprotease [Muricauda sp.]|nr:type II CAAX endopeptidase family protein [Allomuricauda sp.]MBA4744346.1 CPBP family intramembrane metalloprotease [Allomuricauda sp.]
MNFISAMLWYVLNSLNFFSYEAEGIVLVSSFPIIYLAGILLSFKLLKIKWFINNDKIRYSIVIQCIFLSVFLFIFQTLVDVPFWRNLVNGEFRFLAWEIPFQKGAYITVSTILSILVAPVLEEILFRYLIFNSLLKRYGFYFSMVATALLFSMMHLSMEGLFAYFLIGLVYNYIYYLTKSLWLIILVHIIHNISASITKLEFYGVSDSPMILGVIIYIASAYGIILTIKKLRLLVKE